jgi:hypothetical protein
LSSIPLTLRMLYISCNVIGYFDSIMVGSMG